MAGSSSSHPSSADLHKHQQSQQQLLLQLPQPPLPPQPRQAPQPLQPPQPPLPPQQQQQQQLQQPPPRSLQKNKRPPQGMCDDDQGRKRFAAEQGTTQQAGCDRSGLSELATAENLANMGSIPRQLHEETAHLERLSTDRRALQVKVSDLQQDLARADAARSVAAAKQSELEATLNLHKEGLESAVRVQKQADSDYSRLMHQLEQEKQMLLEKESSLEQSQRRKTEAFETEVAANAQKCAAMEAQCVEAQKRLLEWESKLSEANEKKCAAERSLADAEAKRLAVESKHAELEAQVTLLEHRALESEAKKSGLEKKKAEAEQRLAEEEKEYSQKEARIAEVKAKLEKVEKGIASTNVALAAATCQQQQQQQQQMESRALDGAGLQPPSEKGQANHPQVAKDSSLRHDVGQAGAPAQRLVVASHMFPAVEGEYRILNVMVNDRPAYTRRTPKESMHLIWVRPGTEDLRSAVPIGPAGGAHFSWMFVKELPDSIINDAMANDDARGSVPLAPAFETIVARSLQEAWTAMPYELPRPGWLPVAGKEVVQVAIIPQ